MIGKHWCSFIPKRIIKVRPLFMGFFHQFTLSLEFFFEKDLNSLLNLCLQSGSDTILRLCKTMNQSSRHGIVAAGDAAVAGPDRQENTPPYQKLIADCWEHILDYLRFEDMGSMGETCKHIKRFIWKHFAIYSSVKEI